MLLYNRIGTLTQRVPTARYSNSGHKILKYILNLKQIIEKKSFTMQESLAEVGENKV